MAPRDLTEYPEVQTTDLDERPDLSKPSLEGLAWLLRHPGEWPGHRWDFSIFLEQPTPGECGTAGCAIGVAAMWWMPGDRYYAIEEKFQDEMGFMAYVDVFACGNGERTSRRVTPSVVAGRIDDYLAGRPIRYLVEGDHSAAHAVPR